MPTHSSPSRAVAALFLAGDGWFSTESDLAAEARTALEPLDTPPTGGDGSEPPALEDVYEVGTTRDDEPIYVPLVEVDLGEIDDPDLAEAFRTAADVVRALRPVLQDVHVRQYDVVFEYAEGSWWEARGERRRISVTPSFAERVDREPSFDAADLRSALEVADDGDDLLPPVAWGDPLPKRYYRGSGDDVAAVPGAVFGF